MEERKSVKDWTWWAGARASQGRGKALLVLIVRGGVCGGGTGSRTVRPAVELLLGRSSRACSTAASLSDDSHRAASERHIHLQGAQVCWRRGEVAACAMPRALKAGPREEPQECGERGLLRLPESPCDLPGGQGQQSSGPVWFGLLVKQARYFWSHLVVIPPSLSSPCIYRAPTMCPELGLIRPWGESDEQGRRGARLLETSALTPSSLRTPSTRPGTEWAPT